MPRRNEDLVRLNDVACPAEAGGRKARPYGTLGAEDAHWMSGGAMDILLGQTP